MITGDRIDKNDPNGYNGRTQHRTADFVINGDGYSTGASWTTYGTAGGYYTSFLKNGTIEWPKSGPAVLMRLILNYLIFCHGWKLM